MIEAWIGARQDGSLDTSCFLDHLPIYIDVLQGCWSDAVAAAVQRTLTGFLAHCKPGLLLYSVESRMIMEDLGTLCIKMLMERGYGTLNMQQWMEWIVKKLEKGGDEGRELIIGLHQKLLDSSACRSKRREIRALFLIGLTGIYKGLGRNKDLLLSLLQGAVPFIAEYMEDDCEVVDKQCRLLISLLEDMLGDELKQFLG
jgi:hypothetical protein